LRTAIEKEKSYDEVVKEFPELFDQLILDREKLFFWALENMSIKNLVSPKKCSRKIQDRTQKTSRLDCGRDKKNLE